MAELRYIDPRSHAYLVKTTGVSFTSLVLSMDFTRSYLLQVYNWDTLKVIDLRAPTLVKSYTIPHVNPSSSPLTWGVACNKGQLVYLTEDSSIGTHLVWVDMRNNAIIDYQVLETSPRDLVWVGDRLYTIWALELKCFVYSGRGEYINEFVVPEEPRGITFDGQHLVISSQTDNAFYKFDPDGTQGPSFANPQDNITYGLTFNRHYLIDISITDDEGEPTPPIEPG